MNRQEEINKMAKEIASYITSDKDVQVAFYDALKRGAEWADAHPHWIRVEDELPKENGRYLFYHEKIGVQDAYYYNDLTLDKAVTHWMPLPEPPIHSNVEKIGKNAPQEGGQQ